MDIETALQAAVALLEPYSGGTNNPEPNRLDVMVDAEDLRDAVGALRGAGWGYLITISGVDLGAEKDQIEVLYHFASGAAVVTLRVQLSRQDPVVPSVFDIIPSVSFYERELTEMLGVVVEGIASQDRLFLPEDWPAGVYPLRKDFKLEDVTM
jgi:NADH:ubiquinone oxidoreductase subunit C